MFKRIALLLPALALTACVVVIGDDDAELHIDDDRTISHHQSNKLKQDHIIGNRVEDALHNDAQLMNTDISVSNQGQNIILHGELFSAADLQRAIDIAMSDPEVSAVSSRIILTLSK